MDSHPQKKPNNGAYMYCPYHGMDAGELEMTDEHVVPYALGGSDGLTIRVCKDCNSKCGHRVDPLLINNWLFANERLLRGLEGQSGKPPTVAFKGALQNVPGAPDATYTADSAGKKFMFVKPSVEWGDDGNSLSIRVYSEEQLTEVLAGINKRLAKSGRKAISKEEALAAAQIAEVQAPSLSMEFSIDLASFQQPIMKIGVGFAHSVLGNEYSTDPLVPLLRDFMWEDDAEARESQKLSGTIFPVDLENGGLKHIMGRGDDHVLALIDVGERLAHYQLLFGKYESLFDVSASPAKYRTVIPDGGGVVVVLNHSTRTCKRYDLTEFIALSVEARERGASD